MSKIRIYRCGSSGCVSIMRYGRQLTFLTDHAGPDHPGTPMAAEEYVTFVEQARDPESWASVLYEELKMTDAERARVRARVLDGLAEGGPARA